MIEKVVKKMDIKDFSEIKENLEYWLSKDPSERVEAVELLRKSAYEPQQDFVELLALFNVHNVEYVIVGAYALAFHISGYC